MSSRRRPIRTGLPLVASLIATVSLIPAIGPEQIDEFEDGTTLGWEEGPPSPNPPTAVADGGPSGAGDGYLRNVATGGGGPGSRLAMFNTAQWTGDYASTGVRQIELDLADLGSSPLSIRIAIKGGGETWWGSTSAFALPADGQWRSATFQLNASALTRVLGGAELSATLADVSELRILHAPFGPDFQGAPVVATLGVDNVFASLVPVELQRFSVE